LCSGRVPGGHSHGWRKRNDEEGCTGKCDNIFNSLCNGYFRSISAPGRDGKEVSFSLSKLLR